MAGKILHHKPRIPLHEIQATFTRREIHEAVDMLFDSNAKIAKDALENLIQALWTIKVTNGGE